MSDSKAPPLRPTKKAPARKKRKRGRPVANPKAGKQDRSNAGRTKRRAAQRKRESSLKAAPVPPDHPRMPQPNGGALLRGGVPGNRGGYIAAARRHLRKQLLKAVIKGGGLEFLREVIDGKVKRERTKDGATETTFEPVSDDFRKSAIDTALKYGLGEISSHALVNENDEVLEAGVVELPMMDAPPTPPPDAGDALPPPPLSAIARAKALDAASALIEAAK